MYIYLMSKKLKLIGVYCCVFLFGLLTTVAQNASESLIPPPYLKKGDTVAIVAPSGILKNRFTEIDNAKALLKSWGLHTLVGKHIFKNGNHFAGTDAQRCEDFQSALDNPNVKAIWCARGGYGTVRILDKLDYTKFKENPKWLIGYSDITALLNQINNLGYQTIHSIMCMSLKNPKNPDVMASVSQFKKALFGAPISYSIPPSKYNQLGEVNAPIVGGNLTILQTMLGSATAINTAGKVLFFEEIGEYKYHIDRLLQSLKRAGYFENCAGVMVGDMTKLRKNTTVWGTTAEQLILDVLKGYNFPILFNVPSGHEALNKALYFGRKAKVSVSESGGTIVFENL